MDAADGTKGLKANANPFLVTMFVRLVAACLRKLQTHSVIRAASLIASLVLSGGGAVYGAHESKDWWVKVYGTINNQGKSSCSGRTSRALTGTFTEE